MTARYWMKIGCDDIWRLEERKIFDFKNLETGEVVTCDGLHNVIDAKFQPVTMPEAKAEKPVIKKGRPKESKAEKPAKSTPGPKGKSKYKGVQPAKKPGRFRAQVWNGTMNITLGTFDSELLAAEAVQSALGNKKEAKRLGNEYEDGDRRPEVPEDPGGFPSEE